MPDSQPRTLSEHAKSTCVAHLCPQCGLADHVTVEQVLSAGECITLCHCRACGYSWHPVVTRRES
jgi:DNA-directed RNA polymerase subunit M/transcription elongation factor TFIIS